MADQTNAGRGDILLAKYGRSGALQWARLLGGVNWDRGNAVAVAEDGSVYITGQTESRRLAGTESHGEADIVLARYTASGELDWLRLLGGPGYDDGADLAVGSDGSVYLAGRIDQGLNTGESDLLLARFSPTGRTLWQRLRGGMGSDIGDGIAVRGGFVYVTGGSWSERFAGHVNRGEADLVLLKFTTAGRQLWAGTYGGGMIDYGAAVAVADDGSVYVTGPSDVPLCCGEPSDFGDLLVLKYTGDGTRAWERTMGAEWFDDGNDLAVAGDGAVFVAGSSGGEPFARGNSQAVLLKHSPSGEQLNLQSDGGPGYETGNGIALSDGGHIYVVGHATSAFDGEEPSGRGDLVLLEYR